MPPLPTRGLGFVPGTSAVAMQLHGLLRLAVTPQTGCADRLRCRTAVPPVAAASEHMQRTPTATAREAERGVQTRPFQHASHEARRAKRVCMSGRLAGQQAVRSR